MAGLHGRTIANRSSIQASRLLLFATQRSPHRRRRGGGCEWILIGGLSVFAEYDHYFFGNRNLPFTCQGVCGTTTQFVNIAQDIDTWRLGLNWRFGGPASPY